MGVSQLQQVQWRDFPKVVPSLAREVFPSDLRRGWRSAPLSAHGRAAWMAQWVVVAHLALAPLTQIELKDLNG